MRNDDSREWMRNDACREWMRNDDSREWMRNDDSRRVEDVIRDLPEPKEASHD